LVRKIAIFTAFSVFAYAFSLQTSASALSNVENVQISLENLDQNGSLNVNELVSRLKQNSSYDSISFGSNSLNLKFTNTIVKKVDEYSFIPTSLFYRNGIGLDVLAIDMEDRIEYLSILKDYVYTLKNDFDYILIDCPPSSNLITQSAFLMSDYYLIPTVLDSISINGVIHYIKTVKETYKKYCGNSNDDSILFKHYFGKEPELIGIFYNLIRKQVNYDSADKEFRAALLRENIDEDNIFDAFIRHRERIHKSALRVFRKR